MIQNFTTEDKQRQTLGAIPALDKQIRSLISAKTELFIVRHWQKAKPL